MSIVNNYITVQTPRLTISEIKSATALGDGDKAKNWFETATGIMFDGVETIGMVTKVGTSEGTKGDSTWFIINDMKDESIMVSVSGEFTDEELKKAATSVPMNDVVIVRGKANIYKKDDQDRYSIRPRDIVAIDKDDTTNFRKWWYWTVLVARIENNIPILKESDLFSFLNQEKLKFHGIDDDKIMVDATIAKIAPRQVIVTEMSKESKGEPSPKAVVEPIIEKITPKVTKPAKTPSKKVTSVGKDEMVKIRDTILDFIKKSKNPSTDEIRKEMTENRKINEKIIEKAMVDLITGKQIKIDDNDRVQAT